MKKLLILIALVVVFGKSELTAQSLNLLMDGKSDFVLFLDPNADSTTMDAAYTFQSVFAEMCGVQLPVVRVRPEHFYIDFNTVDFAQMKGLSNDGFEILRNEKDRLTFGAKNSPALLNAVYFFFEKFMGAQCFADDELLLPKHTNVQIPLGAELENPSFDFRVIHYYQAYQKSYARWNKLDNFKNNENRLSNVSGEWGMWVHTMHALVPPEKYFKKHPEYFAQRNGHRISDQLCLSNPDVLEICVASLVEKMKQKPSATYWSVSQMDNYSYCQCEKCHAIDSIEGSPSGSIIRFTNQVAQRFPDKQISTLAYQYSRSVPKITKPLPNVNIMLCSIECERSKPIEYYTSKDGFAYDLASWDTITNNILIWDYLINFHHLIGPFPNFQVLKPNINLFKKHGVTMLFEQGYAGAHGEFNELRCYLLAKLMWNPYLNDSLLMDEFLTAYYGDAAALVKEYIFSREKALLESGKSLGTEPLSNFATNMLSPTNLTKYFQLMYAAKEKVAGDAKRSMRVERILQSLRYSYLEVGRSLVFTDDWLYYKNPEGFYVPKPSAVSILDTFCTFAEKNGPTLLHEIQLSPADYRAEMTNYFAHGMCRHAFQNASVAYSIPASKSYNASGNTTLIDGVKGSGNYFALWQAWEGKDVEFVFSLKEETALNRIVVGYMDESHSWIFAPAAIQIEYSTDSIKWKKFGAWTNPKAGENIKKQNVRLEIKSKKEIKATYVKVHITSIGDLPKWRGEKGKAWLFLDEIEAY